jgi:hypothetical protein
MEILLNYLANQRRQPKFPQAVGDPTVRSGKHQAMIAIRDAGLFAP